jgi:hypothetical protein
MSRRLPALPNLEHLRKQAKELLLELRRQTPESKLADAHHAIAVEYGFSNWPALKARVEALAAQRPFRGTWRMHPAKSRRSPENPLERATLEIAVTGTPSRSRTLSSTRRGVKSAVSIRFAPTASGARSG